VLGPYDAWTVAAFEDDYMTTFLVQPNGIVTPEGEPVLRRWELEGPLSPTSQTTVTVTEDGRVVGSLNAVKTGA
jgi:hypothetical protein